MVESAGESNVTPESVQTESSSERVTQALATLKSAGDGGANWFYWIAGLSLVNTALIHFGGNLHFIVGLGITTIVDLIAVEIGKQNPNEAAVVQTIAVVFSVFSAAIVFIFGWLSRKRLLWMYGFGMFLYLLDGLLYLLIGEIASALFHGYALYSMILGFNAYRKLSQLEAAVQNADSERDPMVDAGHGPEFEPA